MRVALLRAINVGGTGRLRMADLRAAGEAAGFRDVSTLGASGNLIYRSDGADDEARLREALLGFLPRPQLTVRDGAALRALVEQAPFAGRGQVPEKWCFTAFLFHDSRAPLPPAPEHLRFVGRSAGEVHYTMAEPTRHAIALSKTLEKALGTPATVRNWNVVRDLAQRAA